MWHPAKVSLLVVLARCDLECIHLPCTALNLCCIGLALAVKEFGMGLSKVGAGDLVPGGQIVPYDFHNLDWFCMT